MTTKNKKRKRFVGIQGRRFELLENRSTDEKFDVTIKAFWFENQGFCNEQTIHFEHNRYVTIKVTLNQSKGRKTVIQGEYV